MGIGCPLRGFTALPERAESNYPRGSEMSKNRMFGLLPKRRLIVSVEDKTVEAIDDLLCRRTLRHPAAGNRSEFVRVAIEKELARWSSLSGSTDAVD